MRNTFLVVLLFINAVAWANDVSARADLPDEAGISVTDILDGLEQRRLQLKGIRASLIMDTFVYPAGSDLSEVRRRKPFCHETFDVRVSGSRIRFKQAQRISPKGSEADVFLDGETAWDGVKEMGLSPDLTKPGKLAGSIASEPGGAIAAGYWETLFESRCFDLRTPLSQLAPADKWTPLGVKSVEGRSIIGIHCVVDSFDFQIWVDPLRGFAPIEVTQKLRNDAGTQFGAELRLTVVEQQRIGDLWVPRKAEIAGCQGGRTSRPDSLMTIDVTDYQCGLEFPDDTFVIQFPRGTSVWDNIQKSAYIVGEGVWAGMPGGGVQFIPAKAAKPPGIPVLPPASPASSSFGSLVRTVMIALGVIAVGVSIWFRVRSRVQHRSS